MRKRKEMSETKDECGESSNTEHKIEIEEGLPNGDLSEFERESGNIEVKDKKTVLDQEVVITRRVLRSGSVARDLTESDKRRRGVKKKGKNVDKGDLSEGEVSFADEVKEQVKKENVKTQGDVKVIRKRGRPRKFGISNQSDGTGSVSNCNLVVSLDKKEAVIRDDKDDKVFGGSCSNQEKTEVKLAKGEFAEAKEIPGAEPEEIPGAEFGSQVKVEIKDDRSDDVKGNVEPHVEEPQVKRRRGRPKKLKISSQSDGNGSVSNFKLGISLDKKEELVRDDKNEKLIGGSCSKEEKTEVKLAQEEFAEAEEIPGVEAEEIPGAEFGSQVKVEIKDDGSDDEKRNVEPHDEEQQVKRKRGRPKTLQISSQYDGNGSVSDCKLGISLDKNEELVTDDKEEKLIGGSCSNEEETEVKLAQGEFAEAEEIPGAEAEEIPGVEAEEIPGAEAEKIPGAEVKEIPGAEFGSQVKVEINDDEKGNVEPYDEERQVKRKRGRPKKLQISSQSDGSHSNTNGKLVKTLDISSQSIVDRFCSRRKRGRPPKTKKTTAGLSIKKEDANCGPESILITSDQSVSDSIDESRRPKSNSGGRAKGPESDGGNCKGRKMARKRGRPATPQKKKESGEADESDRKAKKRLKHGESPLESQHSNPLTDGERRIEEEENKQNEDGRRSKSKSKKMLSDRIIQLLLAAGWTVEYRPRNGREYQDAVYLNPEGKTHWSVTKAYQVYKQHWESSKNGQMDSTTGSSFGLLPEEDLHLLERKVQKKRCDKGKPKLKDGNTNGNMVSTKGLRKNVLKGKIGKQKRRKGSHGSDNLERISVSVRKIKREGKHKRKRCAPSARSSLEDANSKENGYIFFEGKRTILGWMIDAAIVPLNGKVMCMDCKKTLVLREGIITEEGIRCNCCDEVFSVLDFEVHAGGKHNQPFKSLYLEGGNSLLQCLLDSLNKESAPQNKGFHFVDFGGDGDPNDDTCGICGDGGDLICCDACPATFHQSCLDIKKFPSGAWFCCYCSCKFCEKVEAVSHDSATLPPLLSCHLCEEKYHQTCINQDGMVPGEKSTDSFCGKHCLELFEELQLLIGVKHPLPEGFSWTFLRRFELPTEVSHCETSEKIAYNAKMAVAFSVMDECFSPFIDHRSGVNLLQNIVYNFGSNFHRLNFSNFLTAVLEKGDEVIAVASIRIHGNKLAEMPFIGTRSMYRRQGMCRRLLDGIESALGSLKVDKLVIPAVPELIDTWTLGFGFTPVNESGKKTIKNLNLLVFPGVDMLEKSVVKEKIAYSIVPSSNGSLLLAPEMSFPVNVEENKLEESKDSADERNCATADVESSSMNVEDGDKHTESNLKLLSKDLEEKEEIGNLTVKDVISVPDEVDDSKADQTDTKRQERGDLEDKTLLSDNDAGNKAEGTEESDQQSDCIIIDHPQPLSNAGKGKEIDNKNIAIKREVTSTLRVSPRLIQRSWRTSSRVN